MKCYKIMLQRRKGFTELRVFICPCCSLRQDKGLLEPNSQKAAIDFSGTAELLTSHSIAILISCSIKNKQTNKKQLENLYTLK